ncbi:ankyrin repeat domain-containing protein [Streptomyces sp. R-07]|uniref:ankyrin repeat domain-containing protein n=1 Tax=Streptomyces sp. R-07 TaxID=3404052 RepID=UPI003CF1BCBE
MDDRNSRLLTAARRGDADAVRAALEAGAGVEARDEELRSPLLLASLGNHVEAARVLVEAGADPNLADADGVTPLRHARRRGFDGIAALLASH